MELQSTSHSIAWFSDQYLAKKLDLEPPYQRNDLVWSSTYKKYFIDTILQKYPSPLIFLHAEVFPDGNTIYHVVDGKQRLTAIFEFIKGNFTITGSDIPDNYKGIEFKDLDNELKKSIYQYPIPVEEVHNANEKDLREAFDRLNRNVARLSSQELRHARFTGEFIKEIETIADEPFWEDIGIATKANIKRMKLDEFVSEIFLLTMHDIQDGTQSKKLDEYYRDYDDSFPDKDKHMRRYRGMIRIIENLGIEFIRDSRYHNLSDFYSLWAALLPYSAKPKLLDYESTKQLLLKFEQKYNAYVEKPNPDEKNQDIVSYYDNTRQGVNKDANRKNRTDILAKCIKVN